MINVCHIIARKGYIIVMNDVPSVGGDSHIIEVANTQGGSQWLNKILEMGGTGKVKLKRLFIKGRQISHWLIVSRLGYFSVGGIKAHLCFLSIC